MHQESRYARPIAAALRDCLEFRSWFLAKTKFFAYRQNARLMDEEQRDARSSSAKYWWRSHWTDQDGETDLLALFEAENGIRFALHVETKASRSGFQERQAQNYRRRAARWAGSGRNPKAVPEHDQATTVLCCKRAFADKHADEANYLGIIWLTGRMPLDYLRITCHKGGKRGRKPRLPDGMTVPSSATWMIRLLPSRRRSRSCF